MNFDKRGLIKPADKVQMSQDQFRENFVANIFSETRTEIYAQYARYTADFTTMIATSFIQWVGGSFTTAKVNPRDLDLLTIIDQTEYGKHTKLINAQFRKRSPAYPLIDAYFLPCPATDGNNYSLFRGDFLYWVHQFGSTRKSRRGKRYSRGYIEIIHNHFSYEWQLRE